MWEETGRETGRDTGLETRLEIGLETGLDLNLVKTPSVHSEATPMNAILRT